jgi:glycosyltransferase involved in cell wall biosynthesis
MSEYKFSVIIPAYNEEKYIGKCLHFIKKAAERVAPDKVQMIVVANRCTDRTAVIAARHGAKVVTDSQSRCIAAVRNTGLKAADGEIIVTIDADSVMTKDSLREIGQLLESGKFIGGGAIPEFDRMSFGIFVSSMYVAVNLLPKMIKCGGALSGTMFWAYKRDFEAVGGFDEKLVSLEDMDFAMRLKKHGENQGKKYGTLKKSFVITSSRKFDEFGDWYLVKNRSLTKRIFTGTDKAAADEFYYNVRKQP